MIDDLKLTMLFKSKKLKITKNILIPDAPALSKPLRKVKTEERVPFKGVKGVEVKYHALERWNERVGPITTIQTLQQAFETVILHSPYRLTKVSDNHVLLDDDILFIYELENGIVKIISIYGRISLIPALQNVRGIRHFIYKKGEEIGFTPTDEEIARQVMPAIPVQVIEYCGSVTKYTLEIYKIVNQKTPFLILRTSSTKDGTKAIFLTNANQYELTKSTLQILYLAGYRNYVEQQLKSFHKDKWLKIQDNYSNSQIRRFFKDSPSTIQLTEDFEKRADTIENTSTARSV